MSGHAVGFERARAVADAVLWEGYLLYPYRASSRKNQVRWQFGVVGPAGAFAQGVGEPSTMQTECLVLPRGNPVLALRLRFLQLQSRTVERRTGAGPGAAFEPAQELHCGERSWLSWDEAVERELDVVGVPLTARGSDAVSMAVPVEVSGGEEVELLHDEAGDMVGRVVRRRRHVVGRLDVSCEVVGAPEPLLCVRVRLESTAAWTSGDGRDDALALSFLGAHVVLHVEAGVFLSLLEPPGWAASAATACANERCWPVLIGGGRTDGGYAESDVVLASPIILYDRPAIAAESAGELFDSTEIDEILTLRVMTMTDEEKREARATDPRAGAILDRCDDMAAEDLARLHGAAREVPLTTAAGTAGTVWSA